MLIFKFFISIRFVIYIHYFLIFSGTYQVSSSDGGNQLGALKTNFMAITNNTVKVPLVLPAEVLSSNTSSNSNSSSSSGSSSTIKPVVTAALVPPSITLTAVRPSGLKPQPFSQVCPSQAVGRRANIIHFSCCTCAELALYSIFFSLEKVYQLPHQISCLVLRM